MEKISVLEFYSGIGGTHFALKRTNLNVTVLGAYEINTIANAVYEKNFPETLILQKNIEGLTAKDLDKLKAMMWTMSPPCQPYTRQGRQRASDDPRSRSFLNLMEILREMKFPPRYIFMENVKGFEESDTKRFLIGVLKKRKYQFQEFLLSPSAFGIPNSRLRYYMLAVNTEFPFICNDNVLEISSDIFSSTCSCEKNNVSRPCICVYVGQILKDCKQNVIQDYLDSHDNKEYLLKKEILLRFYGVLDIRTSLSEGSCCFTKSYGKYLEGTGSVFTSSSSEEVKKIFKRLQDDFMEENEKLEILMSLGLRYFSPDEVARLLCFPENFVFPENITVKQKYRLLGNSINVSVVSKLMNLFVL